VTRAALITAQALAIVGASYALLAGLAFLPGVG
jgi:hypothetical protein